MKILFRVNPIDLWLKGIDVQSPIVSLEVGSSLLTEKQRALIAKHLLASDDGYNVVHDPKRAGQWDDVIPIGGHAGADLVEAKNPTVESLLEALTELESKADFSPRTEFLSLGSCSSRLQFPA